MRRFVVHKKQMTFEVISPHTLDEALDAMASVGNIVPLAGGTDLMVGLDAGAIPACAFLNLQELRELRPVLSADRGLTLGALTTYRDVRVSPIRKTYPMLSLAAREVGSLAIQSRGTWAGNIINASPAADGVPALMAYDAEVELATKADRRRVLLSQFYSGYKQVDRKPDELVVAIHAAVPKPGWVEYYRKVGARRFQAISKTLLAGRILLGADRVVEDVRLVFASVAPYTLRAIQTENVLRARKLSAELIAEAAKAIQDEIHPIDDIRSTEHYRRRVTSNLVADFLRTSLHNFNW
jgi:CO/xanthine dehydrogenase FAD-binding subunit